MQLQVISSQEQLTKAFGQPQRATGERGSSDPPATGAARCAPDTLRVPDSAASTSCRRMISGPVCGSSQAKVRPKNSFRARESRASPGRARES